VASAAVTPLDPELDHPVLERADQQAQPDHAVADNHERREHGVAGHGRGALGRGHQHQDQPDLDHRDGDRQDQRAERLADP
jgi:hypothetical protein